MKMKIAAILDFLLGRTSRASASFNDEYGDNKLKEILRRVRKIEMGAMRQSEQSIAGDYHSVFRGQGLDFDRVREYFPGDDVRNMDWNVTARTGKPHIKVYVEERERNLCLLVDISASNDFASAEISKREFITELVASLAISAANNGDKISLNLFTTKIEKHLQAKRGYAHILRIIREALFHRAVDKGSDQLTALDATIKSLKRKSVIFLISDFRPSSPSADYWQKFSEKVNVASRKHEVICLIINEKREFELPTRGVFELEDSESGESIIVDANSAKVRKLVAEHERERLANLRTMLRKRGIESLELTVGESYARSLHSFFKRRSTWLSHA